MTRWKAAVPEKEAVSDPLGIPEGAQDWNQMYAIWPDGDRQHLPGLTVDSFKTIMKEADDEGNMMNPFGRVNTKRTTTS